MPNVWTPGLGGQPGTGPMIGIDLGTSNSCVAIWHPGKNRAKVIKNLRAQRLTVSTVAFGTSSEDVVVGASVTESPGPVLAGTKALLGKTREELCESFPPEASIDPISGGVILACQDSNGLLVSVTPEEVSMHILSYLKRCAETYLHRKPVKGLPAGSSYDVITPSSKKTDARIDITRCVIGVPACYSVAQRQATHRAAQAAGFTEVHLMVESSAAAMAYGLLTAGTKTVLVFDMGGGTTDVTVMRVCEGSFTVTATGGQANCGGARIDALMLDLILCKIAAESGLKPEHQQALVALGARIVADNGVGADQLSRNREVGLLLSSSRRCKEALSSQETVIATLPTEALRAAGFDFSLDGAYADSRSAFQCTVQRHELEGCVGMIRLLSLIKQIVGGVLADHYTKMHSNNTQSGGGLIFSGEKLDEIVLVGGCSLMPSVRSAVRSAFRDCGIHWLQERGGSTLSVAGSLSATVGGVGGVIGGGGKVVDSQPVFSTVASTSSSDTTSRSTSIITTSDFCCSINPHEAVALGLAVRAGVLMGVDQGKIKDLLILDVAPKTLGILTFEKCPKTGIDKRIFEPVLLKGTRLPARGLCQFRLDDSETKRGSHQRFATLVVYEEIDRLVLRGVEACASAGIVNGRGDDGDYLSFEEALGNIYTVSYEYNFICSHDFPVGDFPCSQTAKDELGASHDAFRVAYVEITMSEEGDTAMRVLSVSDVQGASAGQQTDCASSANNSPATWMLVLYCALLGLLYLVVKLFIVHPPPQYEIAREQERVLGEL